MRLPFMADVIIFIFSTQFQKQKCFAHVVRLIFLLTCKKKFQWQLLQAKKIHCRDRSSKLYFSKGMKNNPPRSNFHCCGYHKCYLRKPKSQKHNYPIQSNAYLGRSIFEYYLKSMDLFQITVYQISNVTGSKILQKQNRIK